MKDEEECASERKYDSCSTSATESIARAKTAEAELRVEKQRAKNAKTEKRDRRKGSILRIPTPVKFVFLAAVVICLAVFLLYGKGMLAYFNKGETVTSSQLQEVVSVSKLSTANFIYNGIAEKTDENGNVSYRVYYESTVRAGIDMSKITFDIDEENKTVTPLLPEITIDEPVIDDTSLEYMPLNPSAEIKDVIAICKQDAETEIRETGQIQKTAKENLKTTIEALTVPLLDSEYEIKWAEEGEEVATEGVANEDGQ